MTFRAREMCQLLKGMLEVSNGYLLQTAIPTIANPLGIYRSSPIPM